MTTTSIELSIVVPCYNENTNVPVVFDDIINEMTRQNIIPFEIIAVDDGSTDNTLDIIEAYRNTKYSELVILKHEKNRGMGSSLKTGYDCARGEYISFLPSDGEVGADQISKIAKLRSHADIVVTARERSHMYSFYRSVLSYGLHLSMRLILGFSYKGMEGIYLIRKDVYKKLKLKDDGKMINLEIPLRCTEVRCRIVRSNMSCQPRLSGESKVAGKGNVLKEIFLTFKALWKLKYD
jgi:glycosyltransferase involved in cell wall biosynthesis